MSLLNVYIWYPLPHEDEGGFFLVSVGGMPFHMDSRGLLCMGHMGESQLGISLGGLQYQFLAQLANGGPSL